MNQKKYGDIRDLTTEEEQRLLYTARGVGHELSVQPTTMAQCRGYLNVLMAIREEIEEWCK